jgi:hypothetical protein
MLFDCPHQRSGVMMRNYIRLNRSFSVIEPHGPLALNGDECAWHRLDLLRFRAHPCYSLPTDQVSGLRKVWGSAKLGLQTGSSSTILLLADPLMNIRVHFGLCLDGLEFFTERESFLSGNRGGSPHDFSIEYDEFINGNVNGGSQHELMVPNNDYRVCGVYGEVQNWVIQTGLHCCILA